MIERWYCYCYSARQIFLLLLHVVQSVRVGIILIVNLSAANTERDRERRFAQYTNMETVRPCS